MLTASEMKLIMTPKLKPADNDKSRSHLYELLAQRITGHVEPSYISDDMLRGQGDEVRARALYAEKYAPVQEVGFVTRKFVRDYDGMVMTLGCSPDALVSDTGGAEAKSRRQKYQVETILGIAAGEPCPEEYVLQIQACMLITGRPWWDFLSYCGGLPMVVSRVWENKEMQEKILENAFAFESNLRKAQAVYEHTIKERGWHPTERVIETEGEIEVGASE
jgi:hypothetical protein